jgi:hypothetical protein
MEAALATTEPILEPVNPGTIAAPQRRSRGIAIAIALLVLMVVFATWYAVHTIRKVQPPPSSEPTPTAPAPSP